MYQYCYGAGIGYMKFSLRLKAIVFIIILGVLISSISILLNRNTIEDIIIDQHESEAVKRAYTVAEMIDADMVYRLRENVLEIYNAAPNKVRSDDWGTPEFDAYMALYDGIEETEDFKQLHKWLQTIQDLNEVDCIYIVCVDPVNLNAIYLLDAAAEDACPSGCIDEIYEVNYPLLEDPERGFPPYITNTEEYGWLVTVGAPIHLNGEVIAYACTDISMNGIIAEQNKATFINAVILFGVMLIISLLGIFVVNKSIIKPINRLSEVASSYHNTEQELGSLEHDDFARLNIKTGDEIEVLAESMKKMERDLNEHMETLFATRQELLSTREHADILNEIANRDELTGIRNKRGFETEVARINERVVSGYTKVGIVMVDMNNLKVINDSYGHEKGDKLICSLCDTVCSIFKRSPVFRIGGDEFVVVAENLDFDNLEVNVGKFKACIEHNLSDGELEPWDRVSAAIGYAVYDAKLDCGIEDTLKRADDLMYKCKNEMKAGNRKG